MVNVYSKIRILFSRKPNRMGFSLVELVIVIVIIGIIAAIAVPRISHGANQADEAALTSDLAVMRRALELYKAEHGQYPDDDTTLEAQLTEYSDADGNTSPVKTGTHVYGPYISKIPPLPAGDNKGNTDIDGGATPGLDPTAGWWYNGAAGELRANLANDQVDVKGLPLNLK